MQIILLLIQGIVVLSSDPIEAFVVRGQESLEKSHVDSNATVDPCDDFCRFTYTTSPVKALRRNPTFAETTEIFRKIFADENPPADEPESLTYARNHYSACLKPDRHGMPDFDNLKAILELLGGWPVVENDWQSGKNASWRELQIKISKIGFEGFVETYYSTEENAMVLGPASDMFSTRLNDSIIIKFLKWMDIAAMDMGADRYFYEREIQRALDLEIYLTQVAVNKNDKLQNQVDLRTLEVIFNTSTREVMHLFPPHFNLSRDRLKLPVTKLYELQNILDNAPIRTIFNYALMRMVANLTLLSNNPLRRSEQCLTFVSATFPEAQEMLFVRKYLHKNTKKSVQALINQVKEKVKEEAVELNRNLNMVRNWAYVDSSRIDGLFFSLGYPDEFFDNQMIDDYYKNLVIQPVNFLQGMYNYTVFKLSNTRVPSLDFREHLKAYVPPNTSILSDHYMSTMQLYIYAANNTLKYVVYGELVSLLSKIICKTVSIKDYMHAYSFQMPQFKYQIKRSMEKRITDWQTQIPYSMYEDWLEIHGPEPKPPGLENYTNRQIFWIYHSHLECNQENPYDQWWDINCGLRRAFKCGRFH